MEIFFQKKLLIISSTSLLFVPIYTWKSFFILWQDLRKKHNQNILFHKRHNCIITYQSGKGIAGWHNNVKRCLPTSGNPCEELLEPILHFIRTAEKSLDIAVMIINVKAVFRELADARSRGINIRVICNLHHSDSGREAIIELIKQGVDFQFFVTRNSNLDSIMHHKFMIKDCNKNGGFICTGSMNITANSPINNYEDMVFSSNSYFVEQFKKEFNKCWEDIVIDNQGLINKTILMDAGFL